MIQDIVNSTMIENLLANFGLTGLSFGILLHILTKRDKQQTGQVLTLQKQIDNNYAMYIEKHEEMIKEYVELVKTNHTVISQLTTCINAIKETLDRLERK